MGNGNFNYPHKILRGSKIKTDSSIFQQFRPTKKPAPSSDENARRSYTSLHAGAGAGDRMNPVFFFQRTLNPI
jgi:hypothetical protein